MQEIFRVFSAVSGLRPSWGTLIIAIFILISIFISITRTRSEVLRYIFSLYITSVLFTYLPIGKIGYDEWELSNTPLVQILIFVIFFVLISILLTRTPLNNLANRRGNLPIILVLSILGSGFFLSILTNMYNFNGELGATVNLVFANEIARFIWTLIPLIGIILLI